MDQQVDWGALMRELAETREALEAGSLVDPLDLQNTVARLANILGLLCQSKALQQGVPAEHEHGG